MNGVRPAFLVGGMHVTGQACNLQKPVLALPLKETILIEFKHCRKVPSAP